jgi:phospholipid transport system substrate-binding protein
LLAQVLKCLQGQLLRGDRIAGLLKEQTLGVIEEGICSRIKGIERFNEPEAVELVAALLKRLRQRCTYTASLVAQQAQQADSRCAPWQPVGAQTMDAGSARNPVERLDDALLVAMRAGDGTPFTDRYLALAPVVEQVFNLDAVLAASVCLSWTTLPEAQKVKLVTVLRCYSVSSYVSSCDSYNGQSFEVLPSVRAVGNGEVVVQSRLVRVHDSPVQLDYVMRNGPRGWQAVDVLTDGSISRVAMQRSDFVELLRAGGVPALTAGLERKVTNLSGGILG